MTINKAIKERIMNQNSIRIKGLLEYENSKNKRPEPEVTKHTGSRTRNSQFQRIVTTIEQTKYRRLSSQSLFSEK